ncbi:MAG TPA: DUF2306 domain-containing protein [Pyrinomonadaceae bacterium]|nr:DUF2306 domain-containing protein [Pyrinomonadaceae bacterium]
MKVDAKRVVFTAITLATVYVLWHNERFVVQADHPAWQRYESFKWWLLPHAVFGSIVLLFAPFQFSNRLRQRFTKAHRVMGRLYVLGVYVLAPTGAYIQYFQERGGAPRSFTILAIVDAALLIGTTTLAGFFAFKRKIALHRQWATRSYAVALVFIGARLFLGVTGAEALGVEIVQAVIWTCLVASVPLADVALHWYDIRAALANSTKHAVAPKPSVAERLPRAA